MSFTCVTISLISFNDNHRSAYNNYYLGKRSIHFFFFIVLKYGIRIHSGNLQFHIVKRSKKMMSLNKTLKLILIVWICSHIFIKNGLITLCRCIGSKSPGYGPMQEWSSI